MAEFTAICGAFSYITSLTPPPPATLTVHMYAHVYVYAYIYSIYYMCVNEINKKEKHCNVTWVFRHLGKKSSKIGINRRLRVDVEMYFAVGIWKVCKFLGEYHNIQMGKNRIFIYCQTISANFVITSVRTLFISKFQIVIWLNYY